MPVKDKRLTPLELLAAVEELANAGAPDEALNSLVRSYGLGPQEVRALASYYQATGKVPDWDGVDAVVQGMTLGFSDEVRAALDAATKPVSYDDALRAYESARKLFNIQRPVKSAALETAGSVGAGLLLAPFTGGGSTLGTVSRMAALGALEGAGFANEDRLAGAAVGGAFGAALPSATATARVAKRVASPIRKKVIQELSEMLEKSGKQPLDVASEVGRNVVDDTQLGIQTPEILADYIGDPASRRLRGIRARQPDLGEQIDRTLMERYAEGQQAARLSKELIARLQPGSKGYYQALDDLARKMGEEAAPLYEAAYRHTVPLTDELKGILALPDFKRAYARARALARYDDVQLPPLEELLKGGGEVPVQVLDYVKRGIDDYLSTPAVRSALGKARRAKLAEAKQAFLDIVDQFAPEYARARSVFAGHAALRDALEAGRTEALRLPPAELEHALSKLSPSEQVAYRLGALQSYLDLVDKASDNADLVKRLAGSPAARRRLELLVPDEEGRAALERRLAREQQMVFTKTRVMGGSNTVDKTIDALDSAAAAFKEGKEGLARRALEKSLGFIRRRIDELTTKALTEQDPAKQRAILQEVEQLRQAEEHVSRRLELLTPAGVTGATALVAPAAAAGQ